MPHLNLHISGRPDPELGLEAARAVTELTRDILGKQPELTAVEVHFLPHEQWIIGNAPLSQLGRNAFHLDITITDETNTKQEKARYLQQVYARLAELIGHVHEKSYIHVCDVRAAAYGYGGLSQEYRYQHP